MPLEGKLTDSEVERYGAMGGSMPLEYAAEVAGRLYDILAIQRRRIAELESRSCSCAGKA
jgi:hypothetical protein